LNTDKKAEISRVLPSIPPRPSIEVLKKSKFFENKCKNPAHKSNNKDSQLYVQTLSLNTKEILKIKEKFPNISSKKIEEIYRTINNSGKLKLKINMTTKEPSRH